jgi:hypothetical protein
MLRLLLIMILALSGLAAAALTAKQGAIQEASEVALEVDPEWLGETFPDYLPAPLLRASGAAAAGPGTG